MRNRNRQRDFRLGWKSALAIVGVFAVAGFAAGVGLTIAGTLGIGTPFAVLAGAAFGCVGIVVAIAAVTVWNSYLAGPSARFVDRVVESVRTSRNAFEELQLQRMVAARRAAAKASAAKKSATATNSTATNRKASSIEQVVNDNRQPLLPRSSTVSSASTASRRGSSPTTELVDPAARQQRSVVSDGGVTTINHRNTRTWSSY